MLCWAPCTYWGPTYVCTKYCTRTGLWLPFDYCDLAGSDFKKFQSCKLYCCRYFHGPFVSIGPCPSDPLDHLDLLDHLNSFYLLGPIVRLDFWAVSIYLSTVSIVFFRMLNNHTNSDLYHLGCSVQITPSFLDLFGSFWTFLDLLGPFWTF